MRESLTVPSYIREKIIFVDTSAHYALINESDKNHKIARDFLDFAEKNNFRFITSNFILAETHALILKKSMLGYNFAKNFLIEARKSNKMPERIKAEDEERAYQIIINYKDKDFTYTDATSFALMERLGIMKAFTFDQHFAQYGFEIVV
jgi:predicted nucleic acid-binding protein